MNIELFKIFAPYFTSILGAVVAIGIAVYNNSNKGKDIQLKLSKVDKDLNGLQNNLSEVDNNVHGLQNNLSEVDKNLNGLQNNLSEVDKNLNGLQNNLSEVDKDLHRLKDNHFFHLGEYLKKLNAFLHRGKLMDDVERADMDFLADGVSGKI